MQVKITSGYYGYRPENGKHVRPAGVGTVVDVDEAEATRLVSIGVGEILAPIPCVPQDESNSQNTMESPETMHTTFNAEQLTTMTIKQLKALADGMGVDTAKFKVKQDYVNAISAVEVDIEPEAMLNLSAEDPIV